MTTSESKTDEAGGARLLALRPPPELVVGLGEEDGGLAGGAGGERLLGQTRRDPEVAGVAGQPCPHLQQVRLDGQAGLEAPRGHQERIVRSGGR